MGLKLLGKVFIWVAKLENHYCPIHLLIHMFDLSFHRNQLEDPDSRGCALLWGRRPGGVRQGRNGPTRMWCPAWQLPCGPAGELFQLTGEEAGFLTLEHSIPHRLWAASRNTNSYTLACVLLQKEKQIRQCCRCLLYATCCIQKGECQGYVGKALTASARCVYKFIYLHDSPPKRRIHQRTCVILTLKYNRGTSVNTCKHSWSDPLSQQDCISSAHFHSQSCHILENKLQVYVLYR